MIPDDVDRFWTLYDSAKDAYKRDAPVTSDAMYELAGLAHDFYRERESLADALERALREHDVECSDDACGLTQQGVAALRAAGRLPLTPAQKP